jgi:mRNA interferase MazF
VAGSRFELTSGAIALVDLGVPSGHEAGFARPVVIVTAQEVLDANPTVLQVVPVTSKLRGYQTDVALSVESSGLSTVSLAQCQHIRSVSVARITEVIGKVDPVELRQIREVLDLLLDASPA